MGFIKTGVSAIGKLVIVAVLAGAFVSGLIGAVFLSLRGEEVKVPEVVGKDFNEGEKELVALGLKVQKVAARYSQEKPNTILEQRPRGGDTAKTGLMISVIVSEANSERTEAPATVKKSTDGAEETESTDVTPDKTVKTNKNSNVKKPTQTTRDVVSNKSNKNTNSNSADGNSDASNSSKSNSGDTNKSPGNKNSTTNAVNKTPVPALNKTDTTKPNVTKTPAATKPPTSGDTRTRKVP